MITILKITTNGKLYILGEYNVLNEKGNALLYGMKKQIIFEIYPNDEFLYKTRNKKQNFNYKDKTIVFQSNNNDELIKKALEVSFNYLSYKNIEIKEFKLNIETELEDESGNKYGFGSSSAILTGVIKSILKFHKIENKNNLVFKLAVLAQDKLDDLSSGGDLASAINKGVIYYRRYNIKWFNKYKNNISIVEKKWPNLIIEKINNNFNFSSVWTKKSYKTRQLKYKITKKEYKIASKIVKEGLKHALDNNYIEFKNSIIQYQKWLENILKEDKLYTKELKLINNILNKYNLASKISGAGGGDSVIFMYPEGFNFKNLKKELNENNLELIII